MRVNINRKYFLTVFQFDKMFDMPNISAIASLKNILMQIKKNFLKIQKIARKGLTKKIIFNVSM